MRDLPISADDRAEAAAWLARLHADDRTAADEEAFRAWLSASPRHAAAFEAVDRVWTAVGAVPRQSFPVEAERGMLGRRALLAGGIGLLTIAGGGAVFLRSATAKVYQTDIGEQKHVALDDGSEIFLDAQTQVSVSFDRATRAARMAYGRANFQVAGDAARPFAVDAVSRRVVSSACAFDLRCDNGAVQVLLIHGQAEIEAVRPGSVLAPLTLHGGERLVAKGETQTRDRPDMAAETSWQAGYETFESLDLAQAAREMNRYSTDSLQVDPSVAALKVSGVYRVGDNAAFARSVARLLSIAVHQESEHILLTAENNG